MDIVVHWLLVYLLSPLMLPLFMVATLCFMCGARPEPVMRGLLDLCGVLFVSAIRFSETLLRAAYEIWRARQERTAPRPLPKPRPRPRLKKGRPGPA